MKILLFIALVAFAQAKPKVELVQDADMPHLISVWHRYNYTAGKPIRTQGNEPFSDNQKGDVILWQTYKAQTIAPGDLFIADYPDKKMFKQVRQAKSVTATTITTVSGTTIPLSQVQGVVVRIIRVIP